MLEKKAFLAYNAICNALIVNLVFLVSIKNLSKHTSRMAAVQIMYQSEVSDSDLDKINTNFLTHYISKDEAYKDINLSFYKRLVSHFPDSDSFDEIINKNLQSDKAIKSYNCMSKSIIKVAMIEMIFENTDMPIIINEFIEIARYFLDEKGVKFVNAILDTISKQVERKCQKKLQ